MSLAQRLSLVLVPIFCICGAGFFLGFKFQPVEKEVDSILFCSDKPSLIEPRWLLGYMKSLDLSNGFKVQIQEKDHHPVFRHLSVTRFPPSSIYVYYGLREVAFNLADYDNLGLDPEGVIIALHPFQSPKKAPLVYLGQNENLRLGMQLERAVFEEICLMKNGFEDSLNFIDLSKNDRLLPTRTINIGICQKKGPSMGGKMLLVRLNPAHLKEGLKELKAFLHTVPIVGMDKVIKLDLRHRGMGFLQTVEGKREKSCLIEDQSFWEASRISKIAH